jgi:hypothetical protein
MVLFASYFLDGLGMDQVIQLRWLHDGLLVFEIEKIMDKLINILDLDDDRVTIIITNR